MKRFSVRLPLFVVAAVFVLFLCSPDTVQQSAYESVLFCSAVVIPSLFPGFVLSDMLIGFSSEHGGRADGLFFRIFRLPAACFRCWLIGLLAGFPAAADCASHMVLAGSITKSDGERCLAFTNNPGIVFVVCAVGSGLFGSFCVGLYLWTVQTLAALLVGILMANPNRKKASAPTGSPGAIPLSRIFPKAVVSSVSAVLNICGFIIFFRVLIGVLTSAVPLDPIKTLLSGLLEMTCGISTFREFSYFSAIMTSVMLGWSGFSVHFQILNVISVADLSPKFYFPGKVLQALFAAGISAVSYPLIFEEALLRNAVVPAFFTVFLLLAIFLIRFRKEYLYGKQKLRTGKTAS